jgi:hypothetical protein
LANFSMIRPVTTDRVVGDPDLVPGVVGEEAPPRELVTAVHALQRHVVPEDRLGIPASLVSGDALSPWSRVLRQVSDGAPHLTDLLPAVEHHRPAEHYAR